MSTIWATTSWDGAKKQPTSAQMGKKLISRSSVGLTQTGEAAADKRWTDVASKINTAAQREDALKSPPPTPSRESAEQRMNGFKYLQCPDVWLNVF